MAGANKPKPIEITGGDGNIYVVDTWNRGTVADGNVMTDYTIRPICSAIQGGSQGLSAETERAMAAESGISAIVDAHYDEYTTFVSAVNTSAESLSARLADEISDREDGDEYLQDQIDTLKAATDVIMVYNTYSDFTSNSSRLTKTDNDVIKVLNDEERQENQTYYQYSTATSAWTFIGELDPYYSKSDLENAAGKNINITTDENGIHINTNDNVVFTTVTSNGFSGTNLSGATKHYTIDNLFGSAQSGAEASAYITAHSADFLNSAHSAYNKLTFKYGTSTKEYTATNSNYNFTFLAGQGIGFTTGNNQVTISAEGTTYQAGSYISTANKKISVTGSLLTSANAGSAASAWVNNTLFDYSYTNSTDTETTAGSIDKITVLYKNDAHTHDVMYNQELVFKCGEYQVSGLLIQAANNTDDGKVLTYNSAYNNYTWQPIPPTTYSSDDGYISINNTARKIDLSTTGIKTSAYSATYDDAGNIYDSYLNGQTLQFIHGTNSINIALTGVSYYAGGTNNGSAKWDNLFQNYAQVNREKINTTSDLTADKVNFIVATGSSGSQPYKAVNFVVTSTLPSVLESGTYYIV